MAPNLPHLSPAPPPPHSPCLHVQSPQSPGVLHLVPVYTVMQMRPTYRYLDADAAEKAAAEGGSGAGAGACTNCSAGTYGSSMGLTTVSCTGLCAAGRFGSVSGLSMSSCEGACSAGYACPAGSTNATSVVCPPGQYSLSGWSMCNQCPVGLYGESPALPSSTCTAPCPPGRFGSIPGLSTPACTGPCDAGRFGSQPGVNASSCTAACPAGYFCPPGTANATANVGLVVCMT